MPWRTLLLAGLALGLFAVWGPAPERWLFDRAAIADGEWWRLWSGHWVHSDTSHLAWDVGALLILGAAFETCLRWRLPVILLVTSLGVDGWLWWSATAPSLYCGLSAILNALLAAGLAQLWREEREPLAVVVAIVAVGKILVELGAGQSLLAVSAWTSQPAAHAAGFLSGLAWTLACALWGRVCALPGAGQPPRSPGSGVTGATASPGGSHFA